MGKVIFRVYKYEMCSCPYPYPNTTSIIPACFDNSIQTQLNSASGASVGSSYVSSSELDQINDHRDNMYSQDKDDPQSYQTPRGGGLPFLLFW